MSDPNPKPASLADYLSPARLLPGETTHDQLIDGASLCLSGGGYRAMLFHLGALWRLHELDYLRQIRRISSVSGGSITSAWLALNWENLYPPAGPADFETVIVRRICDFANQSMDEPSVLEGMLTLGLQGSKTPDHYRLLYGHATLHDIPDTAPEFVFNSTNLQTGSLVRFSKAKVADWRLGEIPNPHTEVAIAVAASSAFPPFLSPLVFPALPSDFVTYKDAEITDPAFLNHPLLTDGGVYDNLGIETAWKMYRTILVSNADGLNDFQVSPGTDWARQAYRVLMLLYEQVCSLRKRQVIGSFVAGARTGTYWSMASHTADYNLPDTDLARPLPCPPELTVPIAQTPTRLAAMDTDLQKRIINWGYAISDVAVRRWILPGAQRPAGFRYPIGLG
jgi:NTE family protein